MSPKIILQINRDDLIRSSRSVKASRQACLRWVCPKRVCHPLAIWGIANPIAVLQRALLYTSALSATALTRSSKGRAVITFWSRVRGYERPQKFFLLVAIFLMAITTIGCSTNPVTGEKEFVPFSTASEIETGKKYYLTAQQAQGGKYTANPALSKYVTQVGRKLTAVGDRQLPYEFVVLNNGTPNAWALPGGKMAINRGLLLALENEAELAAVLAHEIVHAAARHGSRARIRALMLQLAQVAVLLSSQKSEYSNYIVGGSGVAMGLISQRYGREAERESDYHGIRYMHAAGYDTRAAVTLQEKFLALKKGRKANWLEAMFSTHPPSEERIENNRTAMAKFPEGGDVGREPFDKALADLRAHQPAYELANQARKKIDSSLESALRLVNKAIQQEPREPLFYGLKGQILARKAQYSQAAKAYSAAIKRDPSYYEHFLGRGLAYDALGRQTSAQRDLERSIDFLPTLLANYALGHIALAKGDRTRAKNFFSAIIPQASGEIASEARKNFIKLDLMDAPERYIKAKPFLKNGSLIVELKNKTPYQLKKVGVRVASKVNGQWTYRELSATSLPGRSTIILNGGLRYYMEKEDQLEAKVLYARLDAPGSTKNKKRPYRPYP